MQVREADTSNAPAMVAVLQELITAGKRSKPGDAGFVLSQYIQHPQRLHCFVALDDDGKILGFQSLKLAHGGNVYETPVGWGIIGTHVRPSAGRMGVGSRLFVSTLEGALAAGLPAIEAISERRMPPRSLIMRP